MIKCECWMGFNFIYSQSVDGKDVFLALLGHFLIACLDQVVKEYKGLVHMSVVFAMVVESLPDHLHYLREGHHIVCQV
mgnify:CR=1 FL=1